MNTQNLLTALDHVVVICPDMDSGLNAYQTLFGRAPDWRHNTPDDGTTTSLFRLANTSLELIAPHGSGPTGDRIKELLEAGETGLMSLAFRTDDSNEAHRIMMRRGLQPGALLTQRSGYEGQLREWTRFRCETETTSGIRTFVVHQNFGALEPKPAQIGSVTSMDHLVINTPNPDRAMALYGAKLGLRLALDRTNEEWGARFLFFRLPDLTLEVVNRLDEDKPANTPDHLWGITWKVDDLEGARTRLIAAGLDVSDLREGRKPGTRVMTVRDGTLGVPTLLLQAD